LFEKPLGHDVQLVASLPDNLMNVPAKHSWHAVTPIFALCLPGGQVKQEVAP
jgi:hypothetical protein